MDRRLALAALPFVALAPVLRQLPVPPAVHAPLPWAVAVFQAALLLVLFRAHAWCYSRWQPHAPRRMLVNELLTRLWFVAYGLLLVQRVSPNGWAWLAMAVPWALLSWEVHRNEVRRHGYDMAWNLGNLGLFLLGLALTELTVLRV